VLSSFGIPSKSLGAAVGERMVSEIQREEIEKWLFGNGWAPATIRTKLIDVRTFFRAAVKRGWCAVDPTEAIESVELDDKPPGILMVNQCERLLKSAREVSPEFVGFIALGLFAGIRPEEIEAMQPDDVNIARGFAEVRAEVAKTRQRRLVDLSENCRAWLKVGLDLPPTNPRGRMNKVRLKAGFEGYRKKLVAGREKWIKVSGEEWPHDCMRHSFCSYHLAMHGSADKTAVQMGHRSTDMLFRHYRELVTKEEAEKFWEISP
jgi:integrase